MGIPLKNWLILAVRHTSAWVFKVHHPACLWIGWSILPGSSSNEGQFAKNDSLQRVLQRSSRRCWAKSRLGHPWRHLWQLPKMRGPRYMQRPFSKRWHREPRQSRWRRGQMAMQRLLCQPKQVEHRATTSGLDQSQTDLLPDARLEVQAMPHGKELHREQVLRLHRCLCANNRQPATRQTAKPEPS